MPRQQVHGERPHSHGQRRQKEERRDPLAQRVRDTQPRQRGLKVAHEVLLGDGLEEPASVHCRVDHLPIARQVGVVVCVERPVAQVGQRREDDGVHRDPDDQRKAMALGDALSPSAHDTGRP